MSKRTTPEESGGKEAWIYKPISGNGDGFIIILDRDMPKKQLMHYAYRMDHDYCNPTFGFYADTVKQECSLGSCKHIGCKKTPLENLVNEGSWIIGIGGNGTTKPNMLIYAMKVEGKKTGKPYSKNFHYFGDNAIELPTGLNHLKKIRCKCLCADDVQRIQILLKDYAVGVLGSPNNSRKSCLVMSPKYSSTKCKI